MEDEGFDECYDEIETANYTEMSLSKEVYAIYLERSQAQRQHYLEKKMDFLFQVKLSYFIMDAFDYGLIDYDEYRSRLLGRLEFLEKYKYDFDVPYRAFAFICQACLGDIEWNDHIEEMFTELYYVVFPE